MTVNKVSGQQSVEACSFAKEQTSSGYSWMGRRERYIRSFYHYSQERLWGHHSKLEGWYQLCVFIYDPKFSSWEDALSEDAWAAGGEYTIPKEEDARKAFQLESDVLYVSSFHEYENNGYRVELALFQYAEADNAWVIVEDYVWAKGNLEKYNKFVGSDDDDWKHERAMQAGMAFGCQGYNDEMGY